MSREGSRLPDVVIQASARKAAEEAIPEGVDGEGQGVPREIEQRTRVPRNRGAISWVVLASAAAERVADLAEQARPAAVHRDFLLTERGELA